MSGTPQIYVFFGAPIIPTAPRNSKKEKCSQAPEETWRKLYFSYTKDTSNHCTTKSQPLESVKHQLPSDAVLIASPKDHFSESFGNKCGLVDAFMTDYTTSVGRVKSFSNKIKVLGEPPDNDCSVSGDISRGKCKINLACPKSPEFDTERNTSCTVHHHLGSCPLVSSNKEVTKSRIEDDTPSHFQDVPHLVLNQYPEISLQAVGESKSEKQLDTCSNLDFSTDIEFLSILTSSQVALLSGQYMVGQNETQRKCTELKGAEMVVVCREDTEPLLQLNEPGHLAAETFKMNCQHNADNSVELFGSDNSVQDYLSLKASSFQGNVCESPGTLHSSVNKLDHKGDHLKPQNKRVLGSQENHTAERSMASDNHLTSGGVKRARLMCSPICLLQQTEKRRFPGIKNIQKQPTWLKDCVEKGRKYSVLATVLHPSHIKEIKVGTRESPKVPLATVVVCDQSEVQQKIVLWRTAAFLSLTVFPGDVVLFTDVVVYENYWVGERMLQSTFTTELLNLGRYSDLNPKEVLHLVDIDVLQDLLASVSAKHGYLQALPQRPRQSLENISHVLLDHLRPDTVVHTILKIVSISVLTECAYSFKGEKEKKIILTVEQIKDQTFTLTLWGDLAAHYYQLQRKKDHIWEFKYLFVKHNPVSADLELHTTPWSVLECLFDDDKRAVTFKEMFEKNSRELVKVTTLPIHLEEKCSGIIQVKACISELTFIDPSSYKRLVFDSKSTLSHIFASLALITYVGCEKCGLELQTDVNKIYKQCPTCLPFNKVKVFYRPALMTVQDEGYEISVWAASGLIEKIFLNIPAEWLKKIIQPSLDVTYGMIVADLCHSLLTDPKASHLLTVRSHFVLDENSCPLEKDFHLQDFHLDL